MTPDLINILGEVLSSPWWGAVALGIFMVSHFTWITVRDKSIERRFSQQFETLIKLEEKRAQADLEAAVALSRLTSQVGTLIQLRLSEITGGPNG